jgi:hypothetical protein
MSDLCITVAAYDDVTKAQTDWTLVEALQGLLTNATKSETKVGGDADEVQRARDAES